MCNKNRHSPDLFAIFLLLLWHTMPPCLPEAAWHVWNVICNGIPLSSLTQRVRQVFSLDMKASGDACQSWSPMMMAWGRETASIPLTWELFRVSALFMIVLAATTSIQTVKWTVTALLSITRLCFFLDHDGICHFALISTCVCFQTGLLFLCSSYNSVTWPYILSFVLVPNCPGIQWI